MAPKAVSPQQMCVLKQKQTRAWINHAVAAHSCTSLWLVFWKAGCAFWRGKYPNWTVILIFFFAFVRMFRLVMIIVIIWWAALRCQTPSHQLMSSELQAQKAVALMCQTYSWGIRGKHCGQTRLGGRWAAKTQTRLLAWSNTTVVPFSVEQCEPEWHCCSCAVAVRRWLHGGFCSQVESECQSVGNGRSTLKILKEKTFYRLAVLRVLFYDASRRLSLYWEIRSGGIFFFSFFFYQAELIKPTLASWISLDPCTLLRFFSN